MIPGDTEALYEDSTASYALELGPDGNVGLVNNQNVLQNCSTIQPANRKIMYLKFPFLLPGRR